MPHWKTVRQEKSNRRASSLEEHSHAHKDTQTHRNIRRRELEKKKRKTKNHITKRMIHKEKRIKIYINAPP
jgi:hypothetical protein